MEKKVNLAETKPKWLKTLSKYGGKGACWPMLCCCSLKLSNSFLPNCQFHFCQATHFCSARLNIFVRGGQILQFCSAKLNDDSNTDKNGRKIGKYGRNQTKMAENRLNLAEKLAKYGGKGECWPCSVSALLSFLILFCQTVNFFSAKPPNSVLPS